MRQLKALFGFSLILYALYGIGTVAVPVAQTCCPPPAKKVVRPVGNKQEMEVIALVNKERTRRGMKPLAPSPKMMADADKWSAVQSRSRMHHSRMGYYENVAFGQKDANAVHHAWMTSRGHRKNILTPSHNQIGVGLAYSSSGRPYWTEIFQ